MPQITIEDVDYDLHRRLGFRLSRISNLVQARLEKNLAPFEVSRIEWCVLSGVGLQGITTPSALADHIGITRQAISRLLVQLRKKDIVEQSFDRRDGRSRRLTLTPKGKDLLHKCRPLVDENQRHFADKVSAKELAIFTTVLNHLLADEDALLDQL